MQQTIPRHSAQLSRSLKRISGSKVPWPQHCRRLPGHLRSYATVEDRGRTRNASYEKAFRTVRFSSDKESDIIGDHGFRRVTLQPPPQSQEPKSERKTHILRIDIEGSKAEVPSLLLRDLCSCERCLDPSTKQKLFCTSDIPSDIEAKLERNSVDGGVELSWRNDVPGYTGDHVTRLSVATLQSLGQAGTVRAVRQPMLRYRAAHALWTGEEFSQLDAFDYDTYMQDDRMLLKALEQLYTHGLLFIRNVPESGESVSTIAERIGPVKTTFYGKTWDVRSVPEAKNVAYTSQNLGFHMDLMYMEQPPHLQLLHCIRSSSAGGASTFSDSYSAISHMFKHDRTNFDRLCELPVEFHYNHPDSNLYHQTRNVIGLGSNTAFRSSRKTQVAARNADRFAKHVDLPLTAVDSVSWAPPFQAPLQTARHMWYTAAGGVRRVSDTFQQWHEAAQEFRRLIHRPEYVFERLMQPGECVIFDNRRVLHGRKEFEVDDAGKERWLRGAYIDRDPYMSKLRVLSKRFFPESEAGGFEATVSHDAA